MSRAAALSGPMRGVVKVPTTWCHVIKFGDWVFEICMGNWSMMGVVEVAVTRCYLVQGV